jgi:hypothetical protein
MAPLETSCTLSLEKMGMIYGKNGGMPLHQELYYELIFTW